MNLDRLEDRLDRGLNIAPYAILWIAAVLVVLSVASQTYMWNQRRAYAGLERDAERHTVVTARDGVRQTDGGE